MNQDQIVKSLGDKPLSEIRDVLRGILDLYQGRLARSNSSGSVDAVQLELINRQIEQQIWTQHAVWNKFGNGELGFYSSEELNLRTAPLLTNPKVVKYMGLVNDQIVSAQLDANQFDEQPLFAQSSAVAGSKSNDQKDNIKSSSISSFNSASLASSTFRLPFQTTSMNNFDVVSYSSLGAPALRKRAGNSAAEKNPAAPSDSDDNAHQHMSVDGSGDNDEPESDSLHEWTNTNAAKSGKRSRTSSEASQDSGLASVPVVTSPEKESEPEERTARLRVRPTKTMKAMAAKKSIGTSSTANEKKKVEWTEDMSKRLLEGMKLYKTASWAKVAEYVGSGASAVQCASRWKSLNSVYAPTPAQLNIDKKGKVWTKAEHAWLDELAMRHATPAHWSEEIQRVVPVSVDWARAAQELHCTSTVTPQHALLAHTIANKEEIKAENGKDDEREEVSHGELESVEEEDMVIDLTFESD